jgi:hypothetical protein
MSGGAAHNTDRGLFLAISTVVGVGVVALGIGIWAVLHPGPTLPEPRSPSAPG